MRLTSTMTATALAALLLLAQPPAAYAQVPGQDPHHPAAGAEAAPAPDTDTAPQPSGAQRQGVPGSASPGMMGPQMMQMMPQGMMGAGMMGPGMMGRGMMGPGMLRIIIILADSDGDGTLSLEEVQAVHARIFNAIDANDDGRVTLEELQAFMRGTAVPAPQTPMRQGMPMDGTPGASSQAYMAAMQRMMEGMAAMQMTGEPAADFAMMMIPHHQSASDMAQAYLQHSDDPELTELANEIISAQQEEIEFLQRWLEQRR